jgi:hypothetical protein
MSRTRHSRRPWVSLLALVLVLCAVAAAPAQADTRPLHLGVIGLQFTSFTCLNESCSLATATATGKATSNLATDTGTFQATLTIDFSPGGTCNIVDESDVFSFSSGTLFVQSHHEDCATQGLRIDTTFEVTGGTGAFEGATGGGREFASAAEPSAIIFNGSLTVQ